MTRRVPTRVSVGSGWRPLCDELAESLARLDPPGEVIEVSVKESGLPSFRVRLDRRVRKEGRRLVRQYESRALERCEACGDPGRVHAGAVVTTRCDDCG